MDTGKKFATKGHENNGRRDRSSRVRRALKRAARSKAVKLETQEQK